MDWPGDNQPACLVRQGGPKEGTSAIEKAKIPHGGGYRFYGKGGVQGHGVLALQDSVRCFTCIAIFSFLLFFIFN